MSNRVNSLYLNFSKVNGYFEEIDENKYLTIILSNESKEIIKQYEKKKLKTQMIMMKNQI